MAYSYFTQLFSSGMNKDINPAALDLQAQNAAITQVADSANLLFERGLAITRPGITTVTTIGGLPGTAVLNSVHSTNMLARVPTSTGQPAIAAFAGMTGSGPTPEIFNLNPYLATADFLVPTQITGPALIQGDVNKYWSAATVNGIIMIAGFTGAGGAGLSGMVHWVPGATVYTTVGAPYQYITGHLARGVAAYDLSFATAAFPQTVAWSVPGDETRWGAANFNAGAGISVLGDIDDSITGLGVAQGFVVVARSYGFHLGIPTGATPPYDWRKISGMSIGVMHPASLVIYKNVLFFVSEQGIHMYDLSNVTDIGEGIYKEIIGLAQQYNLLLRGFISPGYAPDFQPSYNIVLDSYGLLPSTTVATLPHYMFNIREQKWSRHLYPTTGTNMYSWLLQSIEAIPNYSGVGCPDPAPIPYLVGYQRLSGVTSPVAYQWSPGSNQDMQAYFTTAQLTLDDQTKDLQVDRLLLVYNAAPGGYTLNITVNWILNGTAQTQTLSLSTYVSGGWDRRWIDFRAVGSFFQVQVKILGTAPTPTLFKALVFEYTITGKVRT